MLSDELDAAARRAPSKATSDSLPRQRNGTPLDSPHSPSHVTSPKRSFSDMARYSGADPRGVEDYNKENELQEEQDCEEDDENQDVHTWTVEVIGVDHPDRIDTKRQGAVYKLETCAMLTLDVYDDVSYWGFARLLQRYPSRRMPGNSETRSLPSFLLQAPLAPPKGIHINAAVSASGLCISLNTQVHLFEPGCEEHLATINLGTYRHARRNVRGGRQM